MKEFDRLLALNNLGVLDSNPEEEFDALVKTASLVCNVPISLISSVDEQRQWFKANIGLPGGSETPRDIAFCAHAILGEEIFVVEDTTKDQRSTRIAGHDKPEKAVTIGRNTQLYANANGTA